MNIVHLTASTFYGGPERQMLGLGRQLADCDRSIYVSFAEAGRCRAFLGTARQAGFETVALQNDTPKFRAAIRELTEVLAHYQADVLLCHGYKASLLGRPAARRAGVPAVAVSRGWTAETWKVRLYETLDRIHLRFMDHVVAVSHAQASKVRRAGLLEQKLSVIHNAVDPERFTDPDPLYRQKLFRYFRSPKERIIGAAGRLSPEKGFNVLVAAAERVVHDDPGVGFVVFGEGACRAQLIEQIAEAGLAGSFVLAGFRADVDRFLPHFDLFVLPSFTEGLPNVVLESCAASVPVVATAVGGTPEVLEDGVSGWLCPPRDHLALGDRLLDALTSEEHLREVGFQGRQRVLESFSFSTQASRYRELFAQLCPVPEDEESEVVVAGPTSPLPTESR